MPAHPPVIAIVGAGAVGGYYGARLAEHGHDVHFLLRSDYETVKSKGWSVKSIAGDFDLRPDRFHSYDDPRKMPAADLIVVTLKSTSSDQFDPLIRPLLKSDSVILTLQNGLGNEERIAELFGPERLIGGLAYVCTTRVAPGQIHHTFNGKIQLGEFTGTPSDRARDIAKLFESSNVTAEVLSNFRWGKWRKLVWNVPFGGLGALLDLHTDELLADPKGVQLVRALMQEVIDAAGALGHQMAPDLIKQMIPYTLEMGHYRSSMQVDRNENRPMEVEAILREPLRQARQAGVEAPRLASLYELLSILDSRRGAACPAVAGLRGMTKSE
ncbi:MAG TPA: 2-dehydropantoate 2-reductase [Tepidisphaeraceae bacterium]|nr:2-dehydropantoate 2-reductase [Tepidisphaeraceae bacterium]